MTTPPFPAAAIAGARDAAKAYLRIGDADEDILVEAMAASALSLAEAFTGQALIAREWTAALPAPGEWQMLPTVPVRSVEGVAGSAPLAPDAYAVDIGRDGTGWVRLLRPGDAGGTELRFRAGLAETWEALPPAVAQGVVLLIAHLFNSREADVAPPAAIRRGDALEGEDMEVAGALGHPAITQADLLAGRWDGSHVRLFAVDWETPGEAIALSEGRIGAVSADGEGFTAELEGIERLLARPVSEDTSPTCRATLGDRRCRVAMAGRRRIVRVVRADGCTLTLDRAVPGGAGGTIAWIGGANGGTVQPVARIDGDVCVLASAPAYPVTAGTPARIAEGCDRRLATCRDRFGNVANFRGEPHLPGIDLLTRYPGG